MSGRPMENQQLIEEYFELHEADNVSRFWKTVQILSYISAAGFSIWCGFTIALLRITFHNRCFLFAKILTDPINGPRAREIRFAEPDYTTDESLWSHDTICEYCQYSMVSSFIFATIWATFFLMCGKGGKSATGLPQPWRIALPALIFNFIYFLIAFAAAVQIQQGTDVFCQKEFSEIINGDQSNKCSVLQVYGKDRAEAIVIKMEIGIKTSWMTALSWFLAFLIPLLRIMFASDFHLYKVCVYKLNDTENQQEEVMNVTDYENIKHVQFDGSDTTQDHEHND